MHNQRYSYLIFTLLSLFLCSSTHIIRSHGFHPDTPITLKDGKEQMPLFRLANLIVMSTWKRVTAYDAIKRKWIKRWIEGVGFSKADCYCRLFFLNDSSPIVCTPIQPFYRVSDQQWVEVYKLRAGDRLLCRDNKAVIVSKVMFVEEPLNVCMLQIESAHTFLVGKQGVVTHNLILEAFINVGVRWDLIGGIFVFDPTVIKIGVLLCSVAGLIYNFHNKKMHATYCSAEGPKAVEFFTQEVKKNHGEAAVSGSCSKAPVTAERKDQVSIAQPVSPTPATDAPIVGENYADVPDDFSTVFGCKDEESNDVSDVLESRRRLLGAESRSFMRPRFEQSVHPFAQDPEGEKESASDFACAKIITASGDTSKDFKKSECALALHEYEFKNSDQVGLRKQIIEDIENNEAACECRSYDIATPVCELLQYYNCDVAAYTYFYGDQLQQRAHQDCLIILERIAYEVHTPSIALRQPNFSDGLVTCVDAAREYNHVGLTEKSFGIIDFCYAFLNCGVDVVKGVLEGTAQGIIGAVGHCMRHPIETAVSVVTSKYVFAYHLLMLLDNVVEIGVDAARAYTAGEKEWNEYLVSIKKQVKELSKKKVSLRDVVEGTTAFVVHWVAQDKLHGGLNKLFKTAKAQAAALTNKIPRATPEPYLRTAEGGIFKTSAVTEHNGLPGCHKPPAFGDKSNTGKRIKPKYPFVNPKTGEIHYHVQTYEEARNLALKIVGDVDQHVGLPKMGKLNTLDGKIVGRKWYGDKVTIRLDYDPNSIKGAHLNVTDFRNGKLIDIAISFEGDQKTVESLCQHLNTKASLEAAKAAYEKNPLRHPSDLSDTIEALKKWNK